MSDDLRLYFFECGSLKTQVQFIKMNQGLGDPYEIPVPFFLITHPRGNVLYDGGNALEVAQNPGEHWGAVVEAYEPVMGEDDFVVNQLQRMDVDPASIRYVIQSHLHLDHSGAIGHFPNAEYVVQRRELEYAYTPDWFQKPAYIRKDFDRDVKWLYLDGEHDDHPFVPHGWSVIVTAPAAFRFTYDAMPGRHKEVAELLAGGPINDADENTLPEILISLMKDVGAPSGVRELGYTEDDIEALIDGAMKQQRLLVGSPKDVTEEDLANILRESMENW
jgi:hypothetical protein